MDREHDHCVYLLVGDEIPHRLEFVVTTPESSFLWHYRLDHPSHHKFQQALPWIFIQSIICELCKLGKHHRANYKSLSLTTSQNPFELVHCNI